MRLPGRDEGQCHSLSVDHDRKSDESAQQEKRGMLLLTSCWSERCKMSSSCRNGCSITDILLEQNVMRLHGQNEGQHHSQAVGHEMKHDKTPTWQERGSVTHILLAMGDVMRSMAEKKVESLTPC